MGRYAVLTLAIACELVCALRLCTGAPSNFMFLDPKQDEFAQSLQSFDITYPSLVSEEGTFLSHTVHRQLPAGIRHKRDTPEHNVNYNVGVGSDVLKISLEPNHKMFAPGLVVERRRSSNLTYNKYTRIGDNKCHYVGRIHEHTNSAVAVATCDGLHGYLRTSKGDYFIEPVKGHNKTSGERHPHLIYHKSALPPDAHHQETDSDHSCGNQEFDEGTTAREVWEREVRGNTGEPESQHRRRKRSVSLERNVETLVVIDPKMMEYYKNEDIETYVLTIFNMVTTMYHDTTIGNAVNIILVKILLLEEEEEHLKITHHADNTLESFCKWQMSINPKDEKHANHHDVAVLLTRYNICSKMNEPCSTLGLSQVSGLCQPHRTCNINEDTGLALAYTVAHEVGHNFAMQHDGNHNGCLATREDRIHIMSPQLNAEAAPLVWSNCSRTSITSFLDRDWGYCLDDEPSDHDFQFPELPAGVMYDADHQCRLQYGPDATYCDGIDEICTTIWCKVNNKCVTRLEAAAEGTICANNKWCFAGQCVDIGERPEAIDGQWGVWGSWTGCSRTCGAGVSYAERHCDNPNPSGGGNYCLGERKRYRICNTDVDCPNSETAPSFHQQQCSEFDTVPYKGHLYKWESVQTPMTPCQLHCKPARRFFSVMLKDMVTDGTPCRPGRKDMCISGRCRTVGCDWVIDSAAKEDRCGICHGDGTNCKTVTDRFSEKVGLGYVEAMIIPVGARNIRVEEVAEANNYLAVRNDKGKYYLNGHWFIQWSGDYEVAGTTLHYKRKGNKESFIAPGPLKEELHVMLLFQSRNPGVVFEFTVPNENGTKNRTLEYKWKYMDWTHCTVSCGGGAQVSEVVCVEMEAGTMVEDHLCKDEKPDDMTKTCNEHLCPARWWVGPWQHCSVTCGENGVRKRTVLCVRSHGPNHQIALEDHECMDVQKPMEIDSCHRKKPCELMTYWKEGPWSNTCNGDPCALQTRIVKCSDATPLCDANTKPVTKRRCNPTMCGSWQTTEWSKCTRSCGGGIQFRSVSCEGGQSCPPHSQPSSERDCNTHDCGSPAPTTPTTAQHAPAASNSSPGTMDTSTKPTTGTPGARNHTQTPLQRLDMKRLQYWKSREYRKRMGNKGKDPMTTDPPLPTESPEEEMFPYNMHHKWMPLFWGPCSRPCGEGMKTRKITCVNTNTLKEVRPQYCKGQQAPEHVTPCQQDPCMMWQYGQWQPCSVSCGDGVQERHVFCPTAGKCDPEKEPDDIRSCPNLPQCTDWISGPWSQCTRTCGGGTKMRHVQCVDSTTRQPATGCAPDGQPEPTAACGQEPCPTETGALTGSENHCKGDVMSRPVCRSLQKMGQCVQRYVQLKCCRTCLHSRHKGEHKATS